ncbi:MAG: hypothetical protein IKD69_12560 [Solobacterium sp.]|nr:hypothetical protein [Solobacterium sp.]
MDQSRVESLLKRWNEDAEIVVKKTAGNILEAQISGNDITIPDPCPDVVQVIRCRPRDEEVSVDLQIIQDHE